MHARTYLEAASGGEVAEVDEVRGGEADGEAEAEAEDAAHEAHRLSPSPSSLPRSRMPAGAAPRLATPLPQAPRQPPPHGESGTDRARARRLLVVGAVVGFRGRSLLLVFFLLLLGSVE